MVSLTMCVSSVSDVLTTIVRVTPLLLDLVINGSFDNAHAASATTAS